MPPNTHPIRLSRAQRGQVRRATTRLLSLERQEFPSASSPGRTYTTAILVGGQVICNCPGWTKRRPHAPRQCVHAFTLTGHRALRANADHLFVVQHMTDYAGTHEFDALRESRIYRDLSERKRGGGKHAG
jgi:hypothetical protein